MNSSWLLKQKKTVPYIIVGFTIVVFALVSILHEIDLEGEFSFTSYQPAFHAILNGTCFLTLLAALRAVKSKNIDHHRKLMSLAMILSLVFLLSYVVYHAFADETSYGGDFQTFYIIILVSHILLAALSLPFILFAYFYGAIGEVEKHKKLVKFVFPVWLYVTLTGVLVFVLLSPYYAQ